MVDYFNGMSVQLGCFNEPASAVEFGTSGENADVHEGVVWSVGSLVG